MRLIQEAADQELVWRQPHGMRQEYELCADDEVLATLRWEKSWGSLAVGETAEESWSFKRSGFWRPRIGVRPLGRDEEVATFVPDWNHNGTLTIGGGRTFRWIGKGFWGLEKAWQERDDSPPIVGFKRRSNYKFQAQLILSPTAAALPETTQLDDLYRPLPPEEMAPPSEQMAELPLLATLGFFLIVLEMMDAAGAAAAST